MNRTISISSSNMSGIRNNQIKKYRPYSSKCKGNKKMVRILSAGNINKSNYCNFPSLNDSKTIKLKRKNSNNSLSEKNKYKIEIEKLYEQNYHYKKIIKKLQTELNLEKYEKQKKDDILNLKNEEIENIITENEVKNLFEYQYIPFCERAKYGLIKKMKNQLKETEQELNDEILNNLNLKKNIKYTKYNELLIENSIFKAHTEKIISLILNSKQYQDNKNKELIQSARFNDNVESQIKIINNYDNNYKNLETEENYLKSEIIKYMNLLNKKSNKVKIIKLKQISLKNQNTKLKAEINDFINNNKNNEISSLEILNKELNKVKNDYNYNKKKTKKTNEKLVNIKKNFSSSLLQYKNYKSNNLLMKTNESGLKMKNSFKVNNRSNSKFNEEYVKNLKKIYQENREKENELEQGLFLFQQAIKRSNDGENINLTEIKETILNTINQKNCKIDTNMINNN